MSTYITSLLVLIAQLLVGAVKSAFSYLGKSKSEISDHEEYTYPPVIKESYWDTLKLLSSTQSPTIFFLRWLRNFGPIFRLNLRGWSIVVVSSDIELTKKILNDKDSKRWQSTVDFVRLSHDGGDDVFSSDGFFWKHSRKGLVRALSPKALESRQDVMKTEIEKFIQNTLEKCASNGLSFDLRDFESLTMSLVCSVLFGYDISPEEKATFFQDYEIMVDETKYYRVPLRWKLGSFIPAVRCAREAGKRSFNLGYRILEAYRKRETPLMDTAIDHIVNNENYKNDKERVNDIVVLMIGGIDTTASTLSWALLLLAKNPVEQEKLRKALELLPMDERIKSAQLNFVIKETMRLQPASAIGVNRNTGCAYKVKKNESNGLQSNIVVPKGSTVFCSFITLFHNPAIYENPESFEPSRWVHPSKKALEAHIPFGFGPRSCIGRSLAKTEISHILARICTDYKFTLETEGLPRISMVYHPVNTRLHVAKAKKSNYGDHKHWCHCKHIPVSAGKGMCIG